MAGNVIPGNGNDEATYVKNLKYACQLFGKVGILIRSHIKTHGSGLEKHSYCN